MKHRFYLLPLITLLLAAQACALPWTPAAETPPPDIFEEITATNPEPTVPSNTPQAETPTQPPTEEPFVFSPEMAPASAFSVEFCYPGQYSNGFMQARVAENPPSDDLPIWGVHPGMIELTLTGYPVDNLYHDPIIRIYPVDSFITLEPRIQTMVDDLQALLTSQDPSPESIPFVPIFNATQMMAAQVKYINFQNGTGVRFITQYSQAAVPISNDSAFYAFIGLTNDGAYLISATLPVTHPLFSEDGMTEPEQGWEAFANDFENHLSTMTSDLADQAPDAFFPHLTPLDEMMRSFQIPPDAIP